MVLHRQDSEKKKKTWKMHGWCSASNFVSAKKYQIGVNC